MCGQAASSKEEEEEQGVHANDTARERDQAKRAKAAHRLQQMCGVLQQTCGVCGELSAADAGDADADAAEARGGDGCMASNACTPEALELLVPSQPQPHRHRH